MVAFLCDIARIHLACVLYWRVYDLDGYAALVYGRIIAFLHDQLDSLGIQAPQSILRRALSAPLSRLHTIVADSDVIGLI